MSKFDFCEFTGGYDDFAVSAEKYSKEEAIKVFQHEIEGVVGNQPGQFVIDSAWVRHRAGVTEDGEPRVCWWIEYAPRKRSCPVWVFSRLPNLKDGDVSDEV